MRGDHRQAERGRELDGGRDMRLVRRQAGALQLEVEAPREQFRQALGQRPGALRVAAEQRLADGALIGAGQRDQARTAAPAATPTTPRPGRAARWPIQLRDSSSHRLR